MNDGRLFGIRIRIHLLFWGVIGLSLLMGMFTEVITLFIIVCIHEMGHVAVARELGWTVTEVQLLPFGGVATIEEAYAADPMDEIVVALAGPFMNIVMMAFSWACWSAGFWTEEWALFFLKSNLIIAGFNLLPIWPLDGGRIIQAILCWYLPYRKAAISSLAASTMLAALMFGIAGLSLHMNVAVVAAYLLAINIQATLRFPYQFIRFLMEKYVRMADEQAVRALTVSPTATVIEVSHLLCRGYTHLVYVRGAGMLPEDELLQAVLFEQKQDTPVSKLLKL
ncbi:M50 family metallopeptidase [Brevibacillus composti]|uniref:M50 family metallopeptidase n=1 Tax=Brevibacillus composti TaxID=2796470 RepID=A0A7T5JMN0_9BACL|nr:M50 family metallopeptidase [Brevibacillus composti]QQE73289.1 M50 family metallopeptidase [Brevibacillus composti]QUO40370.1 M50 family metallopeptidase [Brevibacillus composti]